jgi:hypothetical protein
MLSRPEAVFAYVFAGAKLHSPGGLRYSDFDAESFRSEAGNAGWGSHGVARLVGGRER